MGNTTTTTTGIPSVREQQNEMLYILNSKFRTSVLFAPRDGSYIIRGYTCGGRWTKTQFPDRPQFPDGRPVLTSVWNKFMKDVTRNGYECREGKSAIDPELVPCECTLEATRMFEVTFPAETE